MRIPRRPRLVLGGALLSLTLAGSVLFSQAVHADRNPTGYLPADQAPLGLDVDEVANRLFVANFLGNNESGSYSVIDLNTSQLVANVPVSSPQDVVVNDVTGKAYISGAGNRVSVVNRSNPTQIAKTIGVGNTPKWMAVDEQRNLIYVAIHDGESVQVIDGNSDSVVASIGIPTRSPVEPAVDIAANKIYVAAFRSGGQIAVLSGDSRTKIGDLSVRGDQFEVQVNQATGRVYATSNENNVGWVTVWDRNGTKLGERSICQRLTGLNVNQQTGHVFISCEYGQPADDPNAADVRILDANLNDVDKVPFHPSEFIPGPAIGVDEVRSKVYVGNTYSKVTSRGPVVAVIDDGGAPMPTPTNTPTATATATPTITPTYSPTPFGTPALHVYMPVITKSSSSGW